MFRDAFRRMDHLANKNKPFLFVLDFDLRNPVVIPEEEIDPDEVQFEINGKGNSSSREIETSSPVIRSIDPVSEEVFMDKFNQVKGELGKGNTYLLNLTFETEIELNKSLMEIFTITRAACKLWYRDKFLVFSPERFITIKNGMISTFPMKGTIDAGIPNAESLIKQDVKERAEHATIVDLLRNDLSMVAMDVSVARYRYIESICTGNKTILQTSSEIRAQLLPMLQRKPGSILQQILPAGSVSGAPKKKTLDLIRRIENHQRGYYTGVFGYFDGTMLESAVMIRFIEKRNNRYFYKSGSGITFLSDPLKEYREYLDKIYVPVY